MPVTISITYQDPEVARIDAAIETELGGNTGLTNQQKIAFFKSKLMLFSRKYVEKMEYKAAVQAVSIPDPIVGE